MTKHRIRTWLGSQPDTHKRRHSAITLRCPAHIKHTDTHYRAYLVELVDAADAVVGQHQRAGLHAELARLRVAHHRGRQTRRRGGLACGTTSRWVNDRIYGDGERVGIWLGGDRTERCHNSDKGVHTIAIDGNDDRRCVRSDSLDMTLTARSSPTKVTPATHQTCT
jgi:hypothetical protein